MPQKDLFSDIEARNALDTQAITTDTTTNGEIIDTANFESLTFLFKSGTITDGDYTPLIQEGDESDLSDAAAVADADLIGTEAAAAFTDDADDNQVSKIGYKGHHRYVRFNVVSANTSSGGTVGAVALLGHPIDGPKTDQNATD